IEVVIDVHTVDVVALHDIDDRAHGAPPHLGVAGIHPQIVAVFSYETRIRPRDMCARVERVATVRRAIRIEPRVQLQPSLVRLLDGEGEWVPRRLGSASLTTRDELRPRFIR